MTKSAASGQDEPIKRTLGLKGKCLILIKKYVSTLTLGEGFFMKVNAEFDDLIQMIVGLHSDYVTKENATRIVFEQCLVFEIKHKDRTGALADPDLADVHADFVETLKSFIESLPLTYTLRIKLPQFIGFAQAEHPISDEIKLVTGPHPFDIPGGVRLGSLKSRTATDGDLSTYLEFSSIGYADAFPESPPVAACISLAKQCAFLLTSHGVAKRVPSKLVAVATLTTEHDGTVRRINLPTSLAEFFGRLSPDSEKLLVTESGMRPWKGIIGRAMGGADRRSPTTPNESSNALDALLDDMAHFYAAKHLPDFPSIAAAIEWYQDSLLTDNQTFSYLAACIGLEALLGSDTHMDGMSKRLADRYAFLLGKGRSERERLSKEYTDVLNVRGKLVHAKAARLVGNDKELLGKAQTMLLNLIWHEVAELYRDKPALAES